METYTCAQTGLLTPRGLKEERTNQGGVKLMEQDKR